MIQITTQIESITQTLLEPEIIIMGSTENKTRTLIVTIPIVDENGLRISSISKEYTGQEFNLAYESYESDKDLISKVLKDCGIEIDVDSLPDNLEN